jgi:predicted amidophosphoribosyltransferase
MTGLKDKHIYPWTECSYCHKPLPKGYPKNVCDDCAQKIAKQQIGKTIVKGDKYEF